MSLDSHIVVHSVEIVTSLLNLFPVLLIIFVMIVARRGQALMHVEQHCLIRGHHDHLGQEAVLVDVGDTLVNRAQKVYQLLQRGQD